MRATKPNTFRYAIVGDGKLRVMTMDRRRRRNVITGQSSPILVATCGVHSLAKQLGCSIIVRVRQNASV